MLQKASKLTVTELVSNTNLMQYTDKDVVANGIEIIKEVAEMIDIPFNKYLVLKDFESIVPASIGNKERHVLNYYLKKPWDTLVMKGI